MHKNKLRLVFYEKILTLSMTLLFVILFSCTTSAAEAENDKAQ